MQAGHFTHFVNFSQKCLTFFLVSGIMKLYGQTYFLFVLTKKGGAFYENVETLESGFAGWHDGLHRCCSFCSGNRNTERTGGRGYEQR